MEQRTIEERVAHLEALVNELQSERSLSEDVDHALLKRVDESIETGKRQERVLLRFVDEWHLGQREVTAHLREQSTRLEQIEETQETLIEAARAHKLVLDDLVTQSVQISQYLTTLIQDVQTLAQGQAQLVTMFTGKGKPPRHD